MGQIEQRLTELGIELLYYPQHELRLPKPPQRAGIVTINDLVYTSGTGCKDEDGNLLYAGKVGKDLSIEEGRQAARLALINLLAILKMIVQIRD
jgi:enamine deaminase RidA (YjgF/YER057c/UK114 family)